MAAIAQPPPFVEPPQNPIFPSPLDEFLDFIRRRPQNEDDPLFLIIGHCAIEHENGVKITLSLLNHPLLQLTPAQIEAMRACPTIQVLTQLRLHLGANMYFMNARPSHANCVRDYKRAHDELLPQLGAIRNLIPHTPVEIIGLSALVKHALGRIHMDNPFTQPWTFASFDSHIGGIAQGFWFNYPAGSFVDIAAFRHNVLHSFSPAVANAFAQVFYRNNVRQRFQRPRLSHPLLRDLLPQGYPENVLPFPIDMEDNVINQNNPHVGGGYYNEGDFDSISLVDSSPLEKSNDAFIYDNMSDEDKAAYLADKREKYANMPDEDKAAIVARARLTRVRTGGAKGPWTESEDKQLIKLVKEGYKTWVSLAVNVAGRTSEQCSNR